MEKVRSISTLLLLSLLLTSAVYGQVTTGSIVGTVSDATGGVLPGAEVTIRSPALMGGDSMTRTNERGRYRFPALSPGTYALSIQIPGFTHYVEEGIRVQVGGTVEKNVFLELAAVSEEVNVSGKGPMVDPQKPGVSTNYSKEYMEDVPLRRSGINDFLKAAPGISATYTTYNQHPDVSAFGSGVNENIVLIDGSATSVYAGPGSGPGTEPGTDAIEEVEIVSLGASAEYGNFQGAVFNVVTRQGGNQWRLDASYYTTTQSLTSQPIKLDCQCQEGETGFHRDRFRDFAGYAGGPIIRDRIWVFGGYQYQRDVKSQPGEDPDYAEEWMTDRIFGKLTWQITPKLQSMHSLHYGASKYPVLYYTPDVFADFTWDNTAITFANLTYTVNNNSLWDLRVSGAFPGFDAEPNPGNQKVPLRIDLMTHRYIEGSVGIATGDGRHVSLRSKVSHYAADFLSADHDFKFGVQFEYDKTWSSRTYVGGAVYYDYAGAPYYGWFREPYLYGGQLHNVGLFGEDTIEIGDRLTLNMGMRFDYNRAISPDVPALDSFGEKTEEVIQGLGTFYTWSTLSPRLGFNLALTADTKTLLRGTWGRYYQGLNNHEFKWTHPAITPHYGALYNPATGQYSDILWSADPKQAYGIDPDMRTPRTDQFSIGLDRELRSDLAVGITYSRKDGKNYTGWEDIQGVYGTETVTFSDGRTLTVYPLLSLREDRLFLLTNPEGYYLAYNGLLLTLNKRWSRQWQMLVSYTLSKATGLQASQGLYSQNSAGGLQSFGRDPNDLINADGHLSNDRTHMLRAQGTMTIPKIKATVGVNFQHLTGKPWMEKTYVYGLPQGWRRVFLEPRGARRLSSQTLLDVRLSKSFRLGERGRLELLANILNVLNNKAVVWITSEDPYRPDFREPSRWVEPRSVMLGIKLTL